MNRRSVGKKIRLDSHCDRYALDRWRDSSYKTHPNAFEKYRYQYAGQAESLVQQSCAARGESVCVCWI